MTCRKPPTDLLSARTLGSADLVRARAGAA